MRNNLIEISRNIWNENSIRLILTPSEFARQQLFYIQEAGYFETNQGYYTKRKNLHSYLILHTISGCGELIYHDQKLPLKKGDTFFIDCTEAHSYSITSQEPWIFNWVHFNGLSSDAYYRKFIEYNLSPVLHFNSVEFKEILDSLVSINMKKRNSNEILSSLKITELLTLITLLCQSNSYEDEKSNELTDQIIIFINKHICEKITLDRIASQFNLNKYHLHKKFKKITNIPLNEFIITARLNMVKEKLRFTNESIKEIAETTGFSSASHLINLFKKHEGITPFQYKINWRS